MLSVSITKEEEPVQSFRFFGVRRCRLERMNRDCFKKKKSESLRHPLKKLMLKVLSKVQKKNVISLLNSRQRHKQNYVHKYDCFMYM